MQSNTIGHVLLTALLVAGMTALPASAVGPGAPTGIAAPSPSAEANVSVSTGQQLATVIAVSSDEIDATVEEAGFEARLERANETERARIIANRAGALSERATALTAEHRQATGAFERGDLSTTEYARRIATAAARSTYLLDSLERLRTRSTGVSELELRAAGVNRSRLEITVEAVEETTGPGRTALLRRFTGENRGEIEFETAGGFSIEVEGEDGELSREVKRSRDADPTITVNGSAALATARAALGERAGGWALLESSVHPDSGYYKFEFVLHGANATGEAEVRVDGSTGAVFRIEEEISARERRDGARDGTDDRDDVEDDGIDELAVLVADGTPGPNATVTIRVLANGSAVADAAVSLDGTVVGTTDSNGEVRVTLPEDGGEISVEKGDAEGELEFEFERDDGDDDVYRQLDTAMRVENGTATVTVTYDGAAVRGATVYADGDRVGTTGAGGTVTFDLGAASEDVELEIEKGEFEAELTYDVRDGGAAVIEGPHADDDESRDDRDDGADEEDDEEEEEDDEEKEDEDDEDDEQEDRDEDEQEDDGQDEDDEDSSGNGDGDGDEADEDERADDEDEDEDDDGDEDGEDDEDREEDDEDGEDA